MNIKNAIAILVAELENSNEYKDFKKAKISIDKNKNLSNMLLEFDKKQQALYTENLPQQNIGRLVDDIDNDYKKLSNIPEISQYFNAGENFNTLFNNVIKNINELLSNKLK